MSAGKFSFVLFHVNSSVQCTNMSCNHLSFIFLKSSSSVGGSSFELAKAFDQVEAFDFSQSFITAAQQIQSGEELKINIPVEGDISEDVSVVQEPGVDADVMSKVNFWQGDACALSEFAENKEGFGTYDGVVMANLLCRLPNPQACLSALPQIVNKGGVVVIVTPFTWLEEFTPKHLWLGGMNDPGMYLVFGMSLL